ncbi:MAG: formate/nitrite transporter family protein [Acidimicrobiia bacterium]|nr:formate/nitrite transporter family protein [Acidimicrobiia bacterium]MYC57818.1 formate/nitrite transporter family protein [Acidimicrobiia bacterium]MYI29823.1 formate/nitrite transporter family protein [Acidimicrobiia bacterium]
MSEALTPEEIARKIKRAGIGKAKFDLIQTSILGLMAGAFIGLGGVFALTMAANPELGTGPTRLLLGLAFSLGLFLVVVTGSELFTGNNLMVASFFSRRISGKELTRNWSLAFVANLAGALIVVFLVYFSRWWAQVDYTFSARTIQVANNKVHLSFGTAFMRGLLANILVCLAVWMAVAGRSLVDKMIGIVLPITAFVAAGFEHSIANMFFLPLGWLVSLDSNALAAASLNETDVNRLNLAWISHNLFAVTLGNIVGGALVGLANWTVYLRRQ